tara:strand:- start:431 stop:1180 length:750 start_codon:yes stop_codon:yes gene_type:complete
MKKIIWHKIFNNKKFSYIVKSKDFLRNNNLDTSHNLAKVIHPGINKSQYFKILKFISNKIKIKKNSSLLDFGSGNGAFLYYFINRFKLKNNLSLEVSKPLIQIQKKFIKNSLFIKTSSSNTLFFKKIRFLNVENSICISVFQYFYSNKYFNEILKFLILSTRKNIFIYDLKDQSKKKEYFINLRKRQKLSIKEFKKKYRNTPIRFYDKKFIIKSLEKIKKKYTFKYQFIGMPKGSIDKDYGFCLLIKKI